MTYTKECRCGLNELIDKARKKSLSKTESLITEFHQGNIDNKGFVFDL